MKLTKIQQKVYDYILKKTDGDTTIVIQLEQVNTRTLVKLESLGLIEYCGTDGYYDEVRLVKIL